MWKDVDDDVKAAAEEAASSTIHWRRGGPVGGGRIGAPRFLVVGGAGETLRLDDGSAVDVLGADDPRGRRPARGACGANHAVAVYTSAERVGGAASNSPGTEGGDWDIVPSKRGVRSSSQLAQLAMPWMGRRRRRHVSCSWRVNSG